MDDVVPIMTLATTMVNAIKSASNGQAKVLEALGKDVRIDVVHHA